MKEKHRIHATWDSRVIISNAHLDILRVHTARLKENKWIYPQEIAARRNIWCCSDSSSRGWGFIIYGELSGFSTDMQEESGAIWKPDMSERHIFLKELVAAKNTVFRVLEKYGPNCHIRLGVDNSATYHSLLRMYSANDAAIPHLQELRSRLRQQNSLLSVVLIRSEENASDAASRGRTASMTEAKTCLNVMCRKQIEDGINGIRRNAYDPSKAPARRSLRHPEALDEDDQQLYNGIQSALRRKDSTKTKKRVRPSL
jgi:hypothetical protein